MKEFSKYLGLDVHKGTIAVAVAEARGGEVRYLGEIANSAEAIQKLVKQLRKGDAELSFCYEAGCPPQILDQAIAGASEYS
jgi:transposase